MREWLLAGAGWVPGVQEWYSTRLQLTEKGAWRGVEQGSGDEQIYSPSHKKTVGNCSWPFLIPALRIHVEMPSLDRVRETGDLRHQSSSGINKLPAKETKKPWKLLKDLSVTTSANDRKLSTQITV
ncbi:hypothetical protein llap_8541 [Limosa lapponica baueri]|uniref:Uncharacterized protein n=1 Tax=Limosa lapponica baueri TaxID=1758121 RepID=A0A2I0U520_LIMLA|nr:hypothetical protein llap_8541 [Limosa lapponica baueri]